MKIGMFYKIGLFISIVGLQLMLLTACSHENESKEVKEAGANKRNVGTMEEQEETKSKGDKKLMTNMLTIQAGDDKFTAELENNSSADALVELLREKSLTIEMSDYGGFEKVGSIGTDLPRNDQQITTEPGDLILYQGNSITIYYGTNSWNFTKLGHVKDVTQKELIRILGDEDVTVTFSLEEWKYTEKE